MVDGYGIDLGSVYGLRVGIGKTVSRHEAVLDRQGSMLVGIVRELGETRSEAADLRKTVEGYHALYSATASSSRKAGTLSPGLSRRWTCHSSSMRMV